MGSPMRDPVREFNLFAATVGISADDKTARTAFMAGAAWMAGRLHKISIDAVNRLAKAVPAAATKEQPHAD